MNDSIIESLSVNLKVLAGIPEQNGRISASGCNLSLEPDVPYLGVKRWLTGDSRQHDFSLINSIIAQTIDCTKMLMGNIIHIRQKSDASPYEKEKYISSLLDLEGLADDLENSMKGIRNLTVTYRSDQLMCSRLSVIIRKITTEVSKIKNFISRYNSSSDKDFIESITNQKPGFVSIPITVSNTPLIPAAGPPPKTYAQVVATPAYVFPNPDTSDEESDGDSVGRKGKKRRNLVDDSDF